MRLMLAITLYVSLEVKVDLKRLSDLTNKELMQLYYDAIEMQINQYVRAIRKEMDKRSKEE